MRTLIVALEIFASDSKAELTHTSFFDGIDQLEDLAFLPLVDFRLDFPTHLKGDYIPDSVRIFAERNAILVSKVRSMCTGS